ncbi:hypothetical protein B2J93_3895 [Marssonina coronariae]|uniref:Uncharacterized protein n=1 Tax=Diplocarpon coronariae TaxID=2795749 RepID=A0A218YZ65_9HELO|nr:hypothetical protein B2J93_3895 [Marssonina coronariae]
MAGSAPLLVLSPGGEGAGSAACSQGRRSRAPEQQMRAKEHRDAAASWDAGARQMPSRRRVGTPNGWRSGCKPPGVGRWCCRVEFFWNWRGRKGGGARVITGGVAARELGESVSEWREAVPVGRGDLVVSRVPVSRGMGVWRPCYLPPRDPAEMDAFKERLESERSAFGDLGAEGRK